MNDTDAKREVDEMVFASRSPAETLAFGEALGKISQPGDVFAMTGELGAGKTLLTKGIARGLGIPPDEVTSPTFVLMHVYQGRLSLSHFDAYRLGSGVEMLDLGAEEAWYGEGVSVIEWADRVTDALPPERLDIRLEVAGERARRITLTVHGLRAREMIDCLSGMNLVGG